MKILYFNLYFIIISYINASSLIYKEFHVLVNVSNRNINYYFKSYLKYNNNNKDYNKSRYRFKRFLEDKNIYNNKSLMNLNKTLPKQKKTTESVDLPESFFNGENFTRQNYHDFQLFTNKNAAESTLSYLKQNANSTANETKVKATEEVKFLDLPPGGGMTIPDLELNNGLPFFTYISSIVTLLQTSDFPIDLFKKWVSDRLSFVQLVIQTVRVEGGIIACLIVFVLAALALPSAVLAHISCRLTSGNSADDVSTRQEYSESQLRCRKIVCIVLLDLTIILLPFGIFSMIFSNEYLSKSIGNSPRVTKAVFEDLNTFIRNTHLQIRFIATTAIDKAVDESIADLEDVENLLGLQIQRNLATDTGVDVALDALTDICSASTDVATEVLTLRTEAQAAKEAGKTAQERLRELKKQIDTAKRQCGEKDKLLCDVIDTKGLEITFNVDKLLSERKLSKLRHLGEDNLTSAVEDARLTYQNIPRRVVQATALSRQEIKIILRKQKEALYISAEALEEVSRDFTTAITVASDETTKTVEAIVSIEQWRWLTGLVASLSVLLIWCLVASGAACAHGTCSNQVLPVFLSALVLICTLSVLLWAVASVALILGANGEMLLCKSLYDEPNYTTLGDLFDNPGAVFKHGGLFSYILNGNVSLDVPINFLLSECRLNQPSFPTFNLKNIFNIDSLTNHPTWPKLHGHITNLSVNINDTIILKPILQKYLQDLSQASRVNLTSHRTQITGSLTLMDLNSFADQLERVAGQISDLATSARMETLAARTRKLLGNNLQRLEKHRDEIVYKLTTLEVHLLPLQRQANQSLSHLKTIQYYLANQGDNISKKKTHEYVTRLVKHLEQFRAHVLNQLTYEAAPCRPAWDAYDAARVQLCKHVIEPMNTFWVSTVACLLIFLITTPSVMILINYYRYMFANGYLRRDLNELLLSDQGPWTTSQSTPESFQTPEQSSWTTPRRTSEQLLIPPPRRTPEPSIVPPQPTNGLRRLIETHITPRIKPQHESLRMIEPVSFRNHGVLSPRGWL